MDPSITAAVFVPDYELSTEKARQALPRELPYKDAVYNVSRVGLLPAAMNPMVLAQAAQQGQVRRRRCPGSGCRYVRLRWRNP